MPGLAVLAGIGVAVLLASREEMNSGVIAGAVLVGYGLQLAYRREESGLAISEAFGRGRNGRSHLRAAAMTGDVLIAGVVAAVVVQALRGEELGPLPWLAGAAALTYLISIVVTGDF